MIKDAFIPYCAWTGKMRDILFTCQRTLLHLLLGKPSLTRGLAQKNEAVGGPEEIRTLDLVCAKDALYQLSYRPK